MILAPDYSCPTHGYTLYDDGHTVARAGEGKERPRGHKRPIRHWHCPVGGHTVDVAAAVYGRRRRRRRTPTLRLGV